MVSYQGRRIPAGKDFRPGPPANSKDANYLLLDQASAEKLVETLRQGDYRVASVEVKPFVERPKAPFTTSTLQQEANRKMGFTARRTMQVAQSLYENGYITYMRTDSTSLAAEAVQAARNLVKEQYGDAFLHPNSSSLRK